MSGGIGGAGDPALPRVAMSCCPVLSMQGMTSRKTASVQRTSLSKKRTPVTLPPLTLWPKVALTPVTPLAAVRAAGAMAVAAAGAMCRRAPVASRAQPFGVQQEPEPVELTSLPEPVGVQQENLRYGQCHLAMPSC